MVISDRLCEEMRIARAPEHDDRAKLIDKLLINFPSWMELERPRIGRPPIPRMRYVIDYIVVETARGQNGEITKACRSVAKKKRKKDYEGLRRNHARGRKLVESADRKNLPLKVSIIRGLLGDVDRIEKLLNDPDLEKLINESWLRQRLKRRWRHARRYPYC